MATITNTDSQTKAILSFLDVYGNTVSIPFGQTESADINETTRAKLLTLGNLVNGVSYGYSSGGSGTDMNTTGASLNGATNQLTLTGDDGMANVNVDLTALKTVSVADSVTGDGTAVTPVKLVGDLTTPGNDKYYGTNGTGVKSYYQLPANLIPASNLPQPPQPNGSALLGTSSKYAREDHSHSAAPVSAIVGNNLLMGADNYHYLNIETHAATNAPLNPTTIASVGISPLYARQDHTHAPQANSTDLNNRLRLGSDGLPFLPDMLGADALNPGQSGAVPAPPINSGNLFLAGDGIFKAIASGVIPEWAPFLPTSIGKLWRTSLGSINIVFMTTSGTVTNGVLSASEYANCSLVSQSHIGGHPAGLTVPKGFKFNFGGQIWQTTSPQDIPAGFPSVALAGCETIAEGNLTRSSTALAALSPGVGNHIENNPVGTVTVTLPAGIEGCRFKYTDSAGIASQFPVVITPTVGQRIRGVVNEQYILNWSGGSVAFVYFNAARGWIVE